MSRHLLKPQDEASAGHPFSPSGVTDIIERNQSVCVTSKNTQYWALEAVDRSCTFLPNPRLQAPQSSILTYLTKFTINHVVIVCFSHPSNITGEFY